MKIVPCCQASAKALAHMGDLCGSILPPLCADSAPLWCWCLKDSRSEHPLFHYARLQDQASQSPCGSFSYCPAAVLVLWLPVLPSPSVFHSCLTSANPKGFLCGRNWVSVIAWPVEQSIAGHSWALKFIFSFCRGDSVVVNISGVQFVVSTCI